jgi:hypothetical protein
MSGSRDGERMLLPSNGTSMVSLRLSRTITGNHTHLTFNPTEDQTTSDVPLPTQDGGNSSDYKVPQLSTRKERFSKSKVELIKKTEILESTLRRIKSSNNGTSSTLMNGRVSQPRDNSMIDSDFTSKEISTLSQLSQTTDTLT